MGGGAWQSGPLTDRRPPSSSLPLSPLSPPLHQYPSQRPLQSHPFLFTRSGLPHCLGRGWGDEESNDAGRHVGVPSMVNGAGGDDDVRYRSVSASTYVDSTGPLPLPLQLPIVPPPAWPTHRPRPGYLVLLPSTLQDRPRDPARLPISKPHF